MDQAVGVDEDDDIGVELGEADVASRGGAGQRRLGDR